MTTNREKLLKRINSRKEVYISSLDDNVLLRSLSADEVLDLAEKLENKEISQKDYTYALLIASVMDEEDKPVFDLELVKSLSIDVTTELIEKIAAFNGMQVKFEQAKEDLKKMKLANS